MMVSVNRFIAIAFPLKYSTIFSHRNSAYFVGSLWFLSVLHCIPYFWDFYLDFLFGVILFSAVFLLDTVTFIFVRRRSKELLRVASGTNLREQMASFKKDTAFFVQCWLINMNHCLCMASFHVLLGEYSSKWERLAVTVFLLQFSYIVDTLILIIFHKSFRQLLYKSLCSKKKWAAASASVKSGAG
ncbi:hypothetical protein Y032_1089g3584 [Ancylostoma ceylanicum]|uniref:G-protein coupled receptors family 1 profile domain-containing protein n=1 Tax=Ancylostoma ceylanicum TaxID=53326 RepID=A0A016W6Q6_9BILA|nr:hypothetical protein Y032_1089g3584 [Ancylostoma ceylanicum]